MGEAARGTPSRGRRNGRVTCGRPGGQGGHMAFPELCRPVPDGGARQPRLPNRNGARPAGAGSRSSLSCSPESPGSPAAVRCAPRPPPCPSHALGAAGVSSGPQQRTWRVSWRRCHHADGSRVFTPKYAPGLEPQGGGLRGTGFVTEISKNRRLSERKRAPDVSSSGLGARPGEGVRGPETGRQHVGATYPASVRGAHVRALLLLRLYL